MLRLVFWSPVAFWINWSALRIPPHFKTHYNPDLIRRGGRRNSDFGTNPLFSYSVFSSSFLFVFTILFLPIFDCFWNNSSLSRIPCSNIHCLWIWFCSHVSITRMRNWSQTFLHDGLVYLWCFSIERMRSLSGLVTTNDVRGLFVWSLCFTTEMPLVCVKLMLLIS